MKLRFRSVVMQPAPVVWRACSTMAGVNRELHPLRMSFPAGAVLDPSVTLGVVLFRSWVTWRGIVPLDLHSLSLVSVDEERGFHERSSSWLERVWEHRRTLTPVGDNACEVLDELDFEPRVALFAPLIRSMVTRTFEGRHRHLRAEFGPAPDNTPRALVA